MQPPPPSSPGFKDALSRLPSKLAEISSCCAMFVWPRGLGALYIYIFKPATTCSWAALENFGRWKKKTKKKTGIWGQSALNKYNFAGIYLFLHLSACKIMLQLIAPPRLSKEKQDCSAWPWEKKTKKKKQEEPAVWTERASLIPALW